MKKKKNQYLLKLSLLCLLIIPFNLTNAQVCGISGAKLCVPDAGAIGTGTFEFEPSFSVFNSHKRFNDEGFTESLEGKNIESGLLFRLTVGIAENIEIGTSFSSELEEIRIGSKYNLLTSENYKLGLTAGVSLPAGNKFIPDSIDDDSDCYSTSFGTIISNNLSETASVDLILTYSHFYRTLHYKSLLTYGIGIGIWFTENFQGVFELNAFSTYNDAFHSGKLAAYPGFTYKISPKLLFVLGAQFDIIGKGEDKGIGYLTAFTMTFE